MVSWNSITVKLGDLKPWQRNPKTISKEHAKRLLSLWERLGQFQTIAIGPANEVYDGHQRLNVLMSAYGRDYEVMALQASRALSEKEREELVVAAHVGTVGQFDWEQLSGWDAPELIAWGMDDTALKDWKHDVSALSSLLDSEKQEVDAEPQIDRAAELNEKWQVNTGDLWQIGEHRLLCGDSVNPSDVAKVMHNEKADCIFTSPPYNQGNSSGDLFSHGKRVECLYPHSEDDMTDEKYTEFIFSILNNCSEIVSDLHSIVWNVAYNAKSRNLYGKIVFSPDNPFEVFETIVWNKGGAINLPQVGIYSRWCEFVFVMAKSDKYLTSQTYGNPRWNYWETKKQDQLREHHATYPLEFADRGIGELSLINNIVFDPFLGSGTTMVACENLHRKCRGIEISPNYCAVILERMATAFPELEIVKLADTER